MLKKLLIAAALLGIIIYFLSETTDNNTTAYRARVQQQRREKNRNFRLSPESPLSVEQRQQFDSLKYYPVNPEMLISATLQRSTQLQTVELQMSDTLTEKYLNWGQVRFSVNSQPQTLTLYRRATGPQKTVSHTSPCPTKGWSAV